MLLWMLCPSVTQEWYYYYCQIENIQQPVLRVRCDTMNNNILGGFFYQTTLIIYII